MAQGDGARGRVALALSGGAARTIAHVGVLKVLEREGIGLRAIAGTSGGALIAVLTAAGYPILDLEREAREIGWQRIIDFKPHLLGILSTEKLGEFVRRRIGDLRFEDLRIPCAVVATDITMQSKKVFRSGPVVIAVEASCAIPEFYRPVEWEGHILVDGGVVEPLPIDTLLDLCGPDTCPVLAVSVNRKARHPKPPKHALQLLGQISQVIQLELVRQASSKASVFLEPDMAPFHFFDLDNADRLIAAGERAMNKRLPDLLQAIDRAECEAGSGESGAS
ncbi:MAG: patatin-like phospholipase family protein [Candidatus Eisenbacteria sp.]|nr:patatin-like phospholipase family protein [Candidatus Eisenbacteria bacterium]